MDSGLLLFLRPLKSQEPVVPTLTIKTMVNIRVTVLRAVRAEDEPKSQ